MGDVVVMPCGYLLDHRMLMSCDVVVMPNNHLLYESTTDDVVMPCHTCLTLASPGGHPGRVVVVLYTHSLDLSNFVPWLNQNTPSLCCCSYVAVGLAAAGVAADATFVLLLL